MTGTEVKVWLGLPADAVMRDAEWWEHVEAGMAGVPQPPAGPTDEHMAVFAAFLACSGPASRRLQALGGDPDGRTAS